MASFFLVHKYFIWCCLTRNRNGTPRPQVRRVIAEVDIIDTKKVDVGDTAPDFTLKDHTGEEFTLSHQKGTRVLLSFHPLAWTEVCAQQMKSLEKARDKLSSRSTIAVGISVDSVPSKSAWATTLGVHHTPLLSDFWPHGQVAQRYGLFRNTDGFSERANVIIDENNKVLFVKVYPIATLPNITELLDILDK